MPEGAAYGLDGVLQGRRATARDWSPIRAATRPRRCSRCCRSSQAGLLDASAGIVIDAKSGISGAGRAASDRTHFSENHGSVAAYGVFSHRHTAEMEQELRRRRDVRAAPRAARSRHPRDDLRRTTAARPPNGSPTPIERPTRPSRSCGSRATRCRKSSTSRTPTSATSAGGSTHATRRLVIVSVHRQPGEGRGRPGAAELQRRLRPRRTDGTSDERTAGPEARRRTARSSPRIARGLRRCPRRRRPTGRSSSCTAAGARLTPNSTGAPSRRRRSTACASRTVPTLDVVVSVLAGASNTELVAALVARGRAGRRPDGRGRRSRRAPSARPRIARPPGRSWTSAWSGIRPTWIRR